MRHVPRALVALAATAFALVLLGGPAFAAAEPVVAKDNTVITVPLVLATAVAGIIIPIVHGAITKYRAPNGVKVAVGLLLAGVAGLINTAVALDGVAVISKMAVVSAVLAWITQLAAYFGIYKPVDAPKALAPNVGLG